ncbi:MAG: hypothetical protein U1D70_19495 [Methylobacter sp.]|nr:hypothetical protein [Methylobacter sp.]
MLYDPPIAELVAEIVAMMGEYGLLTVLVAGVVIGLTVTLAVNLYRGTR